MWRKIIGYCIFEEYCLSAVLRFEISGLVGWAGQQNQYQKHQMAQSVSSKQNNVNTAPSFSADDFPKLPNWWKIVQSGNTELYTFHTFFPTICKANSGSAKKESTRFQISGHLNRHPGSSLAGYLSNMISYIRLVIFVPSVFTTGAVDFRMWMAWGLSAGAILLLEMSVFWKWEEVLWWEEVFELNLRSLEPANL